jgi:hypothetical protein
MSPVWNCQVRGKVVDREASFRGLHASGGKLSPFDETLFPNVWKIAFQTPLPYAFVLYINDPKIHCDILAFLKNYVRSWVVPGSWFSNKLADEIIRSPFLHRLTSFAYWVQLHSLNTNKKSFLNIYISFTTFIGTHFYSLHTKFHIF